MRTLPRDGNAGRQRQQAVAVQEQDQAHVVDAGEGALVVAAE
jgi:hypothetical protein